MEHDTFYRSLAEDYHLLYADWNQTTLWQGVVLDRILGPSVPMRSVFDAACGIGTQICGLAARDYAVAGADLCGSMVARARREMALRRFHGSVWCDDMRVLRQAPRRFYGAVLNMINAMPHLQKDSQIIESLRAMGACLVQNGLLLVSVRDYEKDLALRRTVLPYSVYDGADGRRMVWQEWDWTGARDYRVHVHVYAEKPDGGGDLRSYAGAYRAITPAELALHAAHVGFRDVTVLPPAQTGFDQPILRALAP